MRTLIDIQDELMNALLKETKSNTKKEAITIAIKTYLNLKRRERLASLIGKYEFGYTQEDLDRMRSDE
jgi:Arc/MetJ family transcription regulator